MVKKRDRYIISGDMSINGKSLKGLVMVDMGLCGFNGSTESKSGNKLLKSDLIYRKFKSENPKVGKELKLSKILVEFALLPNHVSLFLKKLTEEDA